MYDHGMSLLQSMRGKLQQDECFLACTPPNRALSHDMDIIPTRKVWTKTNLSPLAPSSSTSLLVLAPCCQMGGLLPQVRHGSPVRVSVPSDPSARSVEGPGCTTILDTESVYHQRDHKVSRETVSVETALKNWVL